MVLDYIYWSFKIKNWFPIKLYSKLILSIEVSFPRGIDLPVFVYTYVSNYVNKKNSIKYIEL